MHIHDAEGYEEEYLCGRLMDAADKRTYVKIGVCHHCKVKLAKIKKQEKGW